MASDNYKTSQTLTFPYFRDCKVETSYHVPGLCEECEATEAGLELGHILQRETLVRNGHQSLFFNDVIFVNIVTIISDLFAICQDSRTRV